MQFIPFITIKNFGPKTLFFVALGLVLCTSCHTDDINIVNSKHNTFTAEVVEEITGDIVGYVYDTNGQPVSDATVMIYSASTTTSKDGHFYFKNTKIDKNGTYIKVVKSGFHLGSDMVYPTDNAAVYAYIQMLPLQLRQGFDADNGGKIALEGGGEISFDPRTISYEDGTDYGGVVYYSAYFLSPKNSRIGDVMPGDLIGDAANGNTVVLGTAGMVAVELRDNQGRELNLKPNTTAKINFPNTVTSELNEIATWYFDESKGRWQEDQTALLIDNEWHFEVSHFSFWNCDAPFPLINVCGRVLSSDGVPLSNISILAITQNLGSRYGYTDESGRFCGKMPKNELITLQINGYICQDGSSISDTIVTIGPFTNNTTLDDIILPIQNNILEINLVCNGAPIDLGIVLAKIGDKGYSFKANNGQILLHTGYYFNCNIIDEITLTGINIDGNTSSLPITVSSAMMGPVTLETCDTGCALNVVIEQSDCLTLRAVVTGGSGDYSYEWSTLAKTQEIILNSGSDSTLYCVQVIDNVSQCTQASCKEIQESFGYIQVECDLNLLSFYSPNSLNGYNFLWSTGETTVAINVFNEGDYLLTVTDPIGCEKEYQVYYGGYAFLDDDISSCNLNQVEVVSSDFDNGYVFSNSGFQKNLNSFPIVIDIFEAGFEFTVTIWNNECEISNYYILPKLIDGLSTAARNTSCPSCTDGQITIDVNTAATCQNCTIGTVNVYRKNDYSTTVNALNDAGMLPAGEYTVAVLDQNNTCVIAYNIVRIQ